MTPIRLMTPKWRIDSVESMAASRQSCGSGARGSGQSCEHLPRDYRPYSVPGLARISLRHFPTAHDIMTLGGRDVALAVDAIPAKLEMISFNLSPLNVNCL